MYTSIDFAEGLRLRHECLKLAKGYYLDEPTPGKLRELCFDIASGELAEEDREVLMTFFGITKTQNLASAIDATKAVQMRNVLFFLQERNQKTNKATLNLLAVMLDFKTRPLQRFIREGPDVAYNTQVQEEVKEVEKAEEVENVGSMENAAEALPKKKQEMTYTIDIIPEKPRTKRKYVLTYALLLLSLPATITSWHYFKTPDCMAWSDNHYVAADCDFTGAEVFNDSQFGLREITVKKGDVFFKDEKPIVWYCRRNGYHFFNKRGFDPVTEKPLLPISRQVLMSRNLD